LRQCKDKISTQLAPYFKKLLEISVEEKRETKAFENIILLAKNVLLCRAKKKKKI
jgi:hypothetical protein